MATREEYLAELDTTLRPTRDLLQMVRMGVETQFNPPMTAIALEYGKVLALAAIAASGAPVAGEVLQAAAVDGQPAQPAALRPPQPPPINGGAGSTLIVPER